ncbi:MAG: tryptophan synthase subunit alpha [Cyclobacteriaceae bacterium]|nr:tryptophan synthase subunit alpha [Cyclobacteriaceae bacterium]
MKNRIEQVFTQNKDLLNIYITAGYPQINSLPEIAQGLINQGVDVIEIGMPNSDPLAEGEAIQKASAIALSNGITMDLIFNQAAEIRKFSSSIPLIIMGYFNQLLQFGITSFLQKCAKAGIDGLIIPDLPVKVYQQKYKHLFEQYQVKISFLITPQTSEQRIKLLDAACTLFLYIVSDNSLTGANTNGFSADQINYFKRVKSMSLTSPTMIGFGISSKKMVEEANKYSNGAIIGSAFIKAVDKNEQKSFIDKLI